MVHVVDSAYVSFVGSGAGVGSTYATCGYVWGCVPGGVGVTGVVCGVVVTNAGMYGGARCVYGDVCVAVVVVVWCLYCDY